MIAQLKARIAASGFAYFWRRASGSLAISGSNPTQTMLLQVDWASRKRSVKLDSIRARRNADRIISKLAFARELGVV